jgi:hypothetical protein
VILRRKSDQYSQNSNLTMNLYESRFEYPTEHGPNDYVKRKGSHELGSS